MNHYLMRAYDTGSYLTERALGIRDRALAAVGLTLHSELRSCERCYGELADRLTGQQQLARNAERERDRLAEEIRRITATPPGDERVLTLFPGSVVRLHQPGVEHLGISEGDAVVTSLDEGGVLRMQALKRWLP